MEEGAPAEQGLLHDIMHNPDDDTPRLVYADWLEEHDTGNGQRADRAAFIRTQIALAQIQEDDPRTGELRRRQQGLLAAHREEWEAPLRKLGVRGDVGFGRGFPEDVRMDTDDFLANAGQLFALAPVTSIHLRDPDSRKIPTPPLARWVQELAQSPYLGRVTSLDLSGNNMNDVTAITLFTSPHLANLRSLNLNGNTISIAGTQALARSRSLSNLRSLFLVGNAIGSGGTRALAQSPFLTSLHTLDLGRNYIGDPGARALAESPHLARLTDLGLEQNHIEDEGARALAGSKHLTRLTTLRLARNLIGPQGARAFSDPQRLPGLTHLDLAENDNIGPSVQQEIQRNMTQRRQAQQRT